MIEFPVQALHPYGQALHEPFNKEYWFLHSWQEPVRLQVLQLESLHVGRTQVFFYTSSSCG